MLLERVSDRLEVWDCEDAHASKAGCALEVGAHEAAVLAQNTRLAGNHADRLLLLHGAWSGNPLRIGVHASFRVCGMVVWWNT